MGSSSHPLRKIDSPCHYGQPNHSHWLPMSLESAPAATPSARVTPRLLEGWEWVLLAFVSSRIVIFAVIFLSRLVFVRGPFWHPGGVMSVLLQWDGELWYVNIARNGFSYSPILPSSMGFFPFYPLLIRVASFVFHDFRVAALVVSHLCFFSAGLLLNALVNLDYRDRRINRAAVMFLMFSPVSFFFSNAYSESTFLMLALASFLAARKGNWLLACLCGMCMAATRNVGFLVTLPLFVEYLWQNWKPGARLKALFHPRVLLFALVPLGFVSFLGIGYFLFGDPLAYIHATAVWERQFSSPWKTLSSLQWLPPFYRSLFLTVLVAALVLVAVGIFFKVRASYVVYATILIGIYLCGASLEAIPRYLSVVFPLFIVLGLLAARFPWTYMPIFAASTALLTVCTILSASGYWIT